MAEGKQVFQLTAEYEFILPDNTRLIGTWEGHNPDSGNLIFKDGNGEFFDLPSMWKQIVNTKPPRI